MVTAEDLGMYTCSVSNALGTAATTAILRKAGGSAVKGPGNVRLSARAPTAWPYQGLEALGGDVGEGDTAGQAPSLTPLWGLSSLHSHSTSLSLQ